MGYYYLNELQTKSGYRATQDLDGRFGLALVLPSEGGGMIRSGNKRSSNRWRLGLLLTFALAFGLSACGAGEDVSDLEARVDRVESVLGTLPLLLPSIEIEIGPDGRVDRIADIPARTVDNLAERVTGNPLVGRIVYFNQDYLEWFDRENLQHITVATRPEGLFIAVNGKALPHIVWDGDTLDNLLAVLSSFRSDGSEAFHLMSPYTFRAVETVLPVVRRLNLRFDIFFPDLPDVGPDDRQEIHRISQRDLGEMADRATLNAKPLERVDVELSYEPFEEGGVTLGWVPAVFGFSTVEMQRFVASLEIGNHSDFEIPTMLMREDLRRRLAKDGIDGIGLELREDGLFTRVDGLLLPHLSWDEATLVNMAGLLHQLYPQDSSELPDDALWVPFVRTTAPMFNDYDFSVALRFPVE